MKLTAREWLLLPEAEQMEKQKLTKEERERFINPPKRTDEEIEKNNRTTFKVLQNWKILPKDITFEEWIKAGKPLNY